jgi:hypothetical protein
LVQDLLNHFLGGAKSGVEQHIGLAVGRAALLEQLFDLGLRIGVWSNGRCVCPRTRSQIVSGEAQNKPPGHAT